MTQTATEPKRIIESVLFASGEPVELRDLSGLASLSKPELMRALEELADEYSERGIRLVWDDRSAQLVTAPESTRYLAEFLQSELRGQLSRSALETLAIIAYEGPTTRPRVEAIRGVQSAQPLRTLAIRGLITEVGRTTEPGRPIIYDITLELFKHLGIRDRSQLPPVPDDLKAKLAQADQARAEASA